jgi:hypothetical protein
MKPFLTSCIAILTSLCALATAQFPDKIIYNGKEYSLHSNPMEEYFRKYPDRKPKNGIMSTALWRGYVATFEIRDSQLFLKDIEIEVRDTTGKEKYKTKWISAMKEVLPAGETSIKIDWLTGILVIPYGKIVDYVHMGYASTYENYILLEIQTGKLNKEKKFGYKDYTRFKDRQFEAFRKTDEYKKLKLDLLKKDGYTDEFVDSFLKDYIIAYTSRFFEE